MDSKQPISPSKKLLARKFKKIINTFAKKLDDYINDPNEENIHDIRIAIRRMEAAYRILPKKNRKKEDMQNYVNQVKNLFKINTEIRDFDIIRAKLEKGHSIQFAQIIDSIDNKRKHQINAGHRLALKIKSISPPKLKEKTIIELGYGKDFKKLY